MDEEFERALLKKLCNGCNSVNIPLLFGKGSAKLEKSLYMIEAMKEAEKLMRNYKFDHDKYKEFIDNCSSDCVKAREIIESF